MRLVAAALVLGWSLSGCGNGDAHRAIFSSSPSPSPSSSGQPPATKLSALKACERLVPEKRPSLLISAVQLVQTDQPSSVMLAKAEDDLAKIKGLQPVASRALARQLRHYVAVVEPYLEELENSGTASFQAAPYKAASSELLRTCEAKLVSAKR